MPWFKFTNHFNKTGLFFKTVPIQFRTGLIHLNQFQTDFLLEPFFAFELD